MRLTALLAIGLVAVVIAFVVALPICRRLKQRQLDQVLTLEQWKAQAYQRGLRSARLTVRKHRCIPAVQAAKRRPPHSQLNVGVEQLPRGNG